MSAHDRIKKTMELKYYCRDLEETLTVKDYLKRLLTTLWEEGECFSGKRPFGNSSWDYIVAEALIKEGLIKGRLDSNGYVEEVDREEFDEVMFACINSL